MQKAVGLEYEVTGDGEPVLLIHGALVADALFPLTGESSLADRYRLIWYRRRGHGGSDSVPNPFDMRQQAQDALALLTHLGVKRAHVVGHSGGGVIAVELALLARDLVQSLALIEPAILPPDLLELFPQMTSPILETYRSGKPAQAVDQWMEVVQCGNWRSAVANTVPGGAQQAEQDASTFFEVDFPAFRDWQFDAERASQIRQPVVCLMGSESGPLVEAGKRHLETLFPRAEHVLVRGVDHLMQMGDPKRVAEPIADFLARHPL
jgi:3-oxoadipate enol-lactonase